MPSGLKNKYLKYIKLVNNKYIPENIPASIKEEQQLPLKAAWLQSSQQHHPTVLQGCSQEHPFQALLPSQHPALHMAPF
jgi:hypothetical protein